MSLCSRRLGVQKRINNPHRVVIGTNPARQAENIAVIIEPQALSSRDRKSNPSPNTIKLVRRNADSLRTSTKQQSNCPRILSNHTGHSRRIHRVIIVRINLMRPQVFHLKPGALHVTLYTFLHGKTGMVGAKINNRWSRHIFKV